MGASLHWALNNFISVPRTVRMKSGFSSTMRIALLLLPAPWGPSVMAQAQEIPPIVIRSNVQETTIWARDRVSAPVENSSVTLRSISGSSDAAAAVSSTGANLTIGANTVAQPSTIVVQGDLACEAATLPWTVGANSCSGAIARTFSGMTATATDGAAPETGTAVFACSSGTWTQSGAKTCTAPAPPPPPPPSGCAWPADAYWNNTESGARFWNAGLGRLVNANVVADGATTASNGGVIYRRAGPMYGQTLRFQFTCSNGTWYRAAGILGYNIEGYPFGMWIQYPENNHAGGVFGCSKAAFLGPSCGTAGVKAMGYAPNTVYSPY